MDRGGLLALFLAVKLITKFVGVLPVAIRHVRLHAVFTTLLMSTGLTFGTISCSMASVRELSTSHSLRF